MVFLNKLTESSLIGYFRYLVWSSLRYLLVFYLWNCVILFCVLSFKVIELRLHSKICFIMLIIGIWVFRLLKTLRIWDIFLQLWNWVFILCLAFKRFLKVLLLNFLSLILFDFILDLFFVNFDDSFPTFTIVDFGYLVVALPTLAIHTTYSFELSGCALILFALVLWWVGRLSMLMAFCFYSRSIVFG